MNNLPQGYTIIGNWVEIVIPETVLVKLKEAILNILIEEEDYRSDSKYAIRKYKGQNGTAITTVIKRLSEGRKFKGFSNLKEEHFQELGFTINRVFSKKEPNVLTQTLITL